MCQNKYAPQMPHLCQIFKLVHMQIEDIYVSIYTHMNLIQSAVQQGQQLTYTSHY